MGFRNLFSNAAKTAFTAFGDVPETTYYYAHGSAVYDASSGTVSTGTTQVVVSMIFEQYDQRDVDNANIEPTDLRGMIPQENLSVIPDTRDHIVRIDAGVSTQFDIQNIAQDPAAAMWMLQLRRP